MIRSRPARARHNTLFAGAHDGASRTALLYSLLRTCTQYDVPPLLDSTDVLRKLAGAWPEDELDELQPDRWLELRAPSLVYPVLTE